MILSALAKAFFSLLHPRMLWLMVWPILAALALWLALAAAYWGRAATWINLQLQQFALFEWATSLWPLSALAPWMGWIVLLLLFIPAVLVTAVLIVSFFAMPAMVNHVSARDYPGLERGKGGTVAGSLANAIAGTALFVLLALVTLPLWVLPFLWPVLPLVLLGYLNQRMFRYDALAEHGTAAESAAVIRRWRGELFLLGIALGLLGSIPVLGLVMPIYGGLAFIHYCLARLAQLRASGGTGAVV